MSSPTDSCQHFGSAGGFAKNHPDMQITLNYNGPNSEEQNYCFTLFCAPPFCSVTENGRKGSLGIFFLLLLLNERVEGTRRKEEEV